MQDKSIWRRVAVGVTVLALFAGVAVAGDFTWSGASSGPGDDLFTNEDNWDSAFSGYPGEPPVTTDTATMDDPSLRATSILDTSGAALPLSTLLLKVSSPTKMTLDIDDAVFTVATFTWQDYGRLVVDDLSFTVSSTTLLSGLLWVEVAAIASCDFKVGWVEGSPTRLTAVTSGSTELEFQDLSIDVHDNFHGGGERTLEIDGGTTTVTQKFSIRAETDTGDSANVAKFRLAAGTLTTDLLRLAAGHTADRRVELDIDSDMTVTTKTTINDWVTFPDGGGNINVDVASGKTLDLGELLIVGPSLLQVTSSGTGAVVGKLQTSQ